MWFFLHHIRSFSICCSLSFQSNLLLAAVSMIWRGKWNTCGCAVVYVPFHFISCVVFVCSFSSFSCGLFLLLIIIIVIIINIFRITSDLQTERFIFAPLVSARLTIRCRIFSSRRRSSPTANVQSAAPL